MDQEASSSSFGSSTSTSTSNPEAEGRSTPPDEAPKPELAEQHQSTESGIGDDASFSVAHSASDDHNGSMFHAFSVDNLYKALKPINVEGANNGVLFENRSLSSSSERDDSLVNLDGIDLPSPNAMSNSTSIVRVEQVQQAAFYSDTGPSFQVSVSEQVAGPSENNTAYGVTSQTHVPQCVGTSLQTVAESAFGEGPSFQVSVTERVAEPGENDTAHGYGDTSGSQIQRVGTSSEESAFREEPDFQVSKQVSPQAGEDDTGYGGTSGSQIHVPQSVGTSFKASRVERNSGFSADGSNVLVKTPPRTRDRYPIPVEDQTELYSEDCQEYEKMIKKAVAVSEGHESAGYVRYLTKMIRELDRKNCMKDKLLKKSKKQITEYQLQTHLKEKEIDMLRQQVADTEQENDRHQSKIEHLEREVDCIKFQKEAEEKNTFRFEFIPRGDSPRDVRAKFEKQLETIHQKYQKIVDEKDAEISRLQARNTVTEADALRLEKEKAFAMKNDEINVLLQTVFQLIERHPEKESLHLQMTEKSKSYAHFHSTKKRAESEALSFNTASVQERLKRKSSLYNYTRLLLIFLLFSFHFSWKYLSTS